MKKPETTVKIIQGPVAFLVDGKRYEITPATKALVNMYQHQQELVQEAFDKAKRDWKTNEDYFRNELKRITK